MHILVTGAKGFIGKQLVPALKRAKYQVTEFDLQDGNDIFGEAFDAAVDFSDAVIHLAAQVSVDKSFLKPEATFYTNVLGTARVVQLCMKYKKKLIFPSSAAVYHPELSPYAQSKKLAEDLVVEAQKTLPATVLRFFNVYGEGMGEKSGSVMYHYLHDEEIIVNGDGEQTRDYINVRDVVDVVVEAVGMNWNGWIVDVGTGDSHTTNYIAGLFAQHREKKIKYASIKKEIKWSRADTQALSKLYKKPLQTDLKKDIEALCKGVTV